MLHLLIAKFYDYSGELLWHKDSESSLSDIGMPEQVWGQTLTAK